MKKAITITLIVIGILLIAAIVAPLIFKDEIIAKVKTEINKNVKAKVDFGDVDLSLLRHFPKLSVALEDLSVTGKGEFATDTLVAAKRLDVALNIMSVIRGGKMDIYSVNIDGPRIHAIKTKEGHVNWDIMKEDTTAVKKDTTSSFRMELQHYAIHDAYISYTDDSSNMKAEVINLDHNGSGDFTSDVFTLNTSTTADAVNFTYKNIPYLFNTEVNIDADIQVDNRSDKYAFKTDNIQLNGLKLSLEGFFQIPDDTDYVMDIAFKAPSTDFKSVLSLIPSIYKKDFKDIKTGGEALFNGSVKGTYNDHRIPAYHVNLEIKNGFFQYPGLQPVKNIQLALEADNPDGITDHTVVNISRGHLEMGDTPFDFTLLLKNPVTSTYIDAMAKGNLDLSQVAQFIRLEESTQLSGLLNADIKVQGNVAALEKKQYEGFDASGTLDLQRMHYVSVDYPDGIDVGRLLMTFDPKNITVNNFNGEYKHTHFTATGMLDNLLAYLFRNQPLQGALAVKADQINLNEWMSDSTTSAADTTAITAFEVPANIDFTLSATADKVQYENLDITNASGNVILKDETLYLNDVRGNALDGRFAVNGSYSTKKSSNEPAVYLSYNVDSLDIQKTFLTFNTVQKLMPVARFLTGTLSSDLKLTGRLDEHMEPLLNTLTGTGTALLLNGILNKSVPVDKLAETLNVPALQNLTMKDVRVSFGFDDGRVTVKPFKLNVKGIGMEIGGSHGFDQSLDYTINLSVPRSLFGSQGNALVNNLVAKANNSGAPLKVGDKVDLTVFMTGNLKQPVIKTDLQSLTTNAIDSLKSQVTDYARKKLDSATSTMKDSLNTIREEAIKGLKDQLTKQLLNDNTSDSSNQQGKPLEQAGKQATKTLKNTLNNLLKQKKEPKDS